MIICWAYLKLLVITGTDKLKLVPSNYFLCGWMCLHSCVTSLISLFSFHMGRKSQILESLARKWNTLERNGLTMVATRESITHDSNFSELKPFWRSPAVRVIQISLYICKWSAGVRLALVCHIIPLDCLIGAEIVPSWSIVGAVCLKASSRHSLSVIQAASMSTKACIVVGHDRKKEVGFGVLARGQS